MTAVGMSRPIMIFAVAENAAVRPCGISSTNIISSNRLFMGTFGGNRRLTPEVPFVFSIFTFQTGNPLDLNLFLLMFPESLQKKYSIFFHEILPFPHLLHEEKMR